MLWKSRQEDVQCLTGRVVLISRGSCLGHSECSPGLKSPVRHAFCEFYMASSKFVSGFIPQRDTVKIEIRQ